MQVFQTTITTMLVTNTADKVFNKAVIKAQESKVNTLIILHISKVIIITQALVMMPYQRKDLDPMTL